MAEATAKKRTTRKPAKPVVIPWDDVYPEAQEQALIIAGGDKRRCKPIGYDTVVVVNHPWKEPR